MYQNRICGFLLQSTYNAFHYFPQNCVSKNVFIFLEPPPLGNPKSFHHDSNQQKLKIQTNKVL
jgi:hypothetical protein